MKEKKDKTAQAGKGRSVLRGTALGVAASTLIGCTLFGMESNATAGGTPLAPLPDNPKMQNATKIRLGELLFFDKRLSGDADRSCADCHIPEQGWSQHAEMSIGYPGTSHYRNAPTVVNARFKKYFYWDGRLMGGKDLSTQARDSMTDSHFMASDGRTIQERLKNIPEYVKLFKEVYGKEPYFGRIISAIGAFEQTLISKNVPFDKFLKGDKNAISAQAQKGLALFKGKANCIQCHDGMMLTDNQPYATGVPVNPKLFELERYTTLRSQQMFLGTPGYKQLKQDPGHFDVEKQRKYFGTFVTPTLREVSKTAPYMHNGMLPTLEAVVDYYNNGGGKAVNKSAKIKPLGLSGGEKAQLVAFLNTLSGDDQGKKSSDYTEDKMPKYEVLPWLGVPN